MFKNLKKAPLFEGGIVFILFIGFFFYRITNPFFPSELITNSIFLILLVLMFVFRTSNLRYMYFAFIFLILTVIGNIFGFKDFAYFSGSLVISLLLIGVLNMILFRSEG